MAVVATMQVVTNTLPVAHAGVADCTGTPEEPIYPDYDSSAKLGSYTSSTTGEVLIRRGFYCVPKSSEGNPAAESANGFGFGLDKVQNRHYIGRPQDGYSQNEAMRAVKFVLSAPNSNINSKSDEWGFGWNFLVYANGGTECPKGSHDPDDCENKVSIKVRAATTEGGAQYWDNAGMPVGDPLGLQTVYCDYGDVTRLRCDLWVTAALVKGAEGQNIN